MGKFSLIITIMFYIYYCRINSCVAKYLRNISHSLYKSVIPVKTWFFRNCEKLFLAVVGSNGMLQTKLSHNCCILNATFYFMRLLEN